MFTAGGISSLYPAPGTGAPKSEFRSWAKKLRAALTRHDAAPEVQLLICKILSEFPPFIQAEHVMAYHAFGSEIDLRPVLSIVPGKHYYLGRIESQKTREMSVRLIEGSTLIRHPLGPLQPTADATMVDPALIDVVVMPGLSFDEAGNRLGFGMGFYDRLVARMRPDAIRIGVTYEALVVPTLPSEEHDERVQYLLTETGIRAV